MNEDDLRRHLQEMEPGEVYFVPLDVYEGIFPPGGPDQDAGERGAKMARECGCTARVDVEAQRVRFEKNT